MMNPTEHPTLDEILETVGETYYPEHEYNAGTHIADNNAVKEEAKAALATLIAREKLVFLDKIYDQRILFAKGATSGVLSDVIEAERKALKNLLGGKDE